MFIQGRVVVVVRTSKDQMPTTQQQQYHTSPQRSSRAAMTWSGQAHGCEVLLFRSNLLPAASTIMQVTAPPLREIIVAMAAGGDCAVELGMQSGPFSAQEPVAIAAYDRLMRCELAYVAFCTPLADAASFGSHSAPGRHG